MSSRNSTDWMWSQACELIEQAERMHRQFFRLLPSERTQAVWEPPVDVFEDEREVTIIIALPGVPSELRPPVASNDINMYASRSADVACE